MTRKTIRRLYVDRDFDPPRVGAEVSATERYTLPHPAGKTYDPAVLLKTIGRAPNITIELWERTTDAKT